MAEAIAESIARSRPQQTTLAETYTASGSTRVVLALSPRSELRFEWIDARHTSSAVYRETRLTIAPSALPRLLGSLCDAPIERKDPDLGVRVFDAIVEAVSGGALPTTIAPLRAFLARHRVAVVEWSFVGAGF